MGICASCLGLNRHPSQDGDLDRILDSADQPSYGAIDSDGVGQVDEEELRREREALEHITAQAADHMIDVLHPSHPDYSQNVNHNGSTQTPHVSQDETPDNEEDQEDAEEAAWLESIQSEGLDTVQVPQRGTLAMDLSMLREGPPHQKSAKSEVAY
ncbi:hypothetical protein PRZ48_000075 [Zasmidium cellare]|uniref:Late embryogenesis abundant protein n=1 Tax=Zasmidium cellare TaxID=395010 RepID=A0ABR0EY20_ZASCE|nr:hypothetical protein PRZ48_000075 [Zasmidium cellare]